MKISIVGSGYVGLVTATCLAESGNHVLGVDVDPEKVRALSAGRSTIFEPGLEEMLQANLSSGRLKFTTDLAEGVQHGQVIFITVGTPPREDGSADLSNVESVVRSIGQHMTSHKVVAIKSTVPVGTGARMSELLMGLTAHPFALVSNPEFLKEGSAVEDFLRPDRVVIGCDDPDAAQLLSELYAPFARTSQTIMLMSRDAAEMVKYASNAYLATRISFINEVADICARAGVDINQVRLGMGADRRIGQEFLNPGVGYGGSCFPKDVQAMISVAQALGCKAELLGQVHARNEYQKRLLAQMVCERFGNDLKGKTFAVWGLAFKPNTDDIREAPAIKVIRLLLSAGAALKCYDPKACANAAAEFAGVSGVSFVHQPYDALENAEALIICTDWSEFRSPDFDRIRTLLKGRVIFDGRNLYDAKTMLRQRLEYHSIGRAPVIPDRSNKSPSVFTLRRTGGSAGSPKQSDK